MSTELTQVKKENRRKYNQFDAEKAFEVFKEMCPTLYGHNSSEKQYALASLEVAEMVEKPHKDLLKDIRRYTTYLAEGKISPGEFWNETTYIDANNQSRPCYQITKKGCEFIAHKMTGAKGAIFTARYINRFHEMEKKLSEPALMDRRMEIARLIVSAPKERVEDIKELYPEYFTIRKGSLEYISDVNTSFMKWIEDYGITKDWIGSFPTIDIYHCYMRYCVENKCPSMGKKVFYKTLEYNFNMTRRQRSGGSRYFMSA